ncbi:hypothetical protein D8L93_03815 [Sodalis-like symbiont of Bactericera trigonica]|nr:hypothetical protein D8L93_03815 [Sodalis-like symbiont of Bactericera trigonica]
MPAATGAGKLAAGKQNASQVNRAYERSLVYQILPVLWGTIWQISVNNWLRLILQAGQDAINKKARTGLRAFRCSENCGN